MPRTARIHHPGGVFHLVSRFARDEPWLDRPGARDAYLTLLGKAVERTDVQILAYCLMSNHAHLVVVQGETPLERFTKSVHTGFASFAHRSVRGRGRKAQGPVFAGRPRAVLVDKDSYLLELVRYVHNNPVRAGVVRSARNSDWSSHRAYVGRAKAPAWLRIGYVLDRFGSDARRAVARFDAFVEQGRSEPRRPELSGAADAAEAARVRHTLGDGHRLSDGVLGSAAFVRKVQRDADKVQAALSSRGREQREGAVGRPSLREVIDAVLAHRGVEVLELQERPRSRSASGVKRLVAWLWVHEYAGKQVEVARALELDTSVVSRHYGEALAAAGDFDEEATAVRGLLATRKRPRPRKETAATAGAQAVRYHVDVDEQ